MNVFVAYCMDVTTHESESSWYKTSSECTMVIRFVGHI